MLVQTFLLIPPSTSEGEKVGSTILLPKGKVKELVIRFLSGCGDLTHFSVKCNSHFFYRTSPEEVLNVKGLVRLDLKDYELTSELNPVRLEGYNEDEKAISRLKVDFVFDPAPDSRSDNLLQIGGR